MKVPSSVKGASHPPNVHGKHIYIFNNFLVFLISQYHQTPGGRHYSNLLNFYMLSRLCYIRSNIIAQGFMACGLKMQPEMEELGQKWDCLCPPGLVVRAGSGRDKQSCWLRAHLPTCQTHEFPWEDWEPFGFGNEPEKWKYCSKHP